jgi:hypothetical protein
MEERGEGIRIHEPRRASEYSNNTRVTGFITENPIGRNPPCKGNTYEKEGALIAYTTDRA